MLSLWYHVPYIKKLKNRKQVRASISLPGEGLKSSCSSPLDEA